MATLKTTIRTPSVVRTIVRGMGRPGTGGSSLIVREVDGTPSGTASTLIFPSGTVAIAGNEATITGLQGPQGATGPQGPTGATGATGAQGAPGPNLVSTATDTDLNGVLIGTSGKVSWRDMESLGSIYDFPEGLAALTCADFEWTFGSVDYRNGLREALQAVGTTFETVNANLQSLPHTINRTGGRISSIVYTLPNASTITKTINRTGDVISSIVLTGATPAGIQLTKTITRTAGVITGVSYS